MAGLCSLIVSGCLSLRGSGNEIIFFKRRRRDTGRQSELFPQTLPSEETERHLLQPVSA